MSILLWMTTEMEYKIKCYNRSILLLRLVINLTIKGFKQNKSGKEIAVGFCHGRTELNSCFMFTSFLRNKTIQ